MMAPVRARGSGGLVRLRKTLVELGYQRLVVVARWLPSYTRSKCRQGNRGVTGVSSMTATINRDLGAALLPWRTSARASSRRELLMSVAEPLRDLPRRLVIAIEDRVWLERLIHLKHPLELLQRRETVRCP